MTKTALHGALIVGPYKGYRGCAEFDSDDGVFYGESTETNDIITFRGSTPTELRASFEQSIDVYLEYCKSRGESPDKPYSGKFVVRVTPELHHKLAAAAASAAVSLNQFVTNILRDSTQGSGDLSNRETAQSQSSEQVSFPLRVWDNDNRNKVKAKASSAGTAAFAQ